MGFASEDDGSRPRAPAKAGGEASLTVGAFSLTLANAVSQAVNYGIHVGVGRVFRPVAYGYFGIIVSIFSLMETGLRWGLARAVAFYVAREKSGGRQILKTALKLQSFYALICFGVFLLFSDSLARVLGELALGPYLRWSAFFIPAVALVPVYTGFLNGTGAFGRQGTLTIVRSLARLVLIVGLLAYGAEIYGVIAAYLASAMVAAAYGYGVSRPEPGPHSAAVGAKQLILFGLPLFVSSLAASLLMRMDLFMIQSLLGDTALTGLYAAAAALIKAPYFIALGPSHVVFRRAAQLHVRSPEQARAFVSGALYYYVVALAPVPFILAAAADPILQLTFGAAYRPAAPVFSILSFCFVFMILFELVINLTAGLGRPRWSMMLSVGLLPAQFFLIRWWTYAGGLEGAALASTLCWTVGALMGTGYLVWGGHLELPVWKTLVKVALGCSAVFFAAHWGPFSGVWLLTFAPLSYLLYLGLMRMMGELSDGELRSVMMLLLPARRTLPILKRNP